MKKKISIAIVIITIFSILSCVFPFGGFADTALTLKGLYDASNYSTYGKAITFNNDDRAITSENGTSKARLNYTNNMTDFEADITASGNSSGGLYLGYGIRFQENNFTATTFNTPGYMLVAKRESTSLSKLTIFIRYVNESSNRTAEKTLIADTSFFDTSATKPTIDFSVSVSGKTGTAKVINKANNKEAEVSFDLELSGSTYFAKGALGFVFNGVHTITDFSAKSKAGLTENDIPAEKPTMKALYDNYGAVSIDSNGFTSTSSTIARGLLKDKNVADFSASVDIKVNPDGELKAGFIFRAQSAASGTDDLEGYSAVIQKKTSTGADYNRMMVGVYKYGLVDGNYKYLGQIALDTNTAVLADYCNSQTAAAGKIITFHINVVGDVAQLYFECETKKSQIVTAYLNDPTDIERKNQTPANVRPYYPSGKIGYYLAKGSLINALGLNVGAAEEIVNEQKPEGEFEPGSVDGNFTNYGTVLKDDEGYYYTQRSIARGVINNKTVSDFKASVDLKVGDYGELKGGIIFRAQSVTSGNDDMEGYAAILLKKPANQIDYNRVVMVLYKYGVVDGNYKYLGTVGIATNLSVLGYYANSESAAAGQVVTLHLNVVGTKAQMYFEGKTNPDKKDVVRRSQLATFDLKNETDVENKENIAVSKRIYYENGKIGYYIAKSTFIDAKNMFVIASDALWDNEVQEGEETTGDTDAQIEYSAAQSVNYGTLGSNGSKLISSAKHTIIAPIGVDDIGDYSSNFNNYSLYSSSTTNGFDINKGNLLSDTAGTKRAILDGVSTTGFNAKTTIKIGEEGTLKSGIVFRVNDIDGSLMKDGTLGANEMCGYAAILYKTPGQTEDYGRVVICIYKYGLVKGKRQYLGTVASKATTEPLKDYNKKVTDAAGQELTLCVNVIDDNISAYCYNTNKPSLKSETLNADLTAITDIENTTPSLSGVNYKSGAIGLTATNYAEFTDFSISEPIMPSNDVGNLADLDSYTIYSTSGKVNKSASGYFESESSGTKKLIVNNLTVSDFTASFDTKIDKNGNLKSGILFRANNIGNGPDDQEGYAIVLVRNYSTLGATNPNRIDIVIFKWGLQNGKKAYLGEVAREVYKSGASFMDGKMNGKEITFVVKVKGAAIDATAYLTEDPSNKPITFSSNLKFAGKNEKGSIAYYDKGSIGLMMMNTVSDPLTHNYIRNFNIDDGSGVSIKSTKYTGSLFSPVTGYGIMFTVIVAIVVVLSASGFFLVLKGGKFSKFFKERRIKS